MNLKRLGLFGLIALIIFSILFGIQSQFMGKEPVEMVSLFKVSFLYFSGACMVTLILLELMSTTVPDKLAIGFLLLTMIKLGGFILIYMSREDIPKFIRLMILVPMFLGVVVEVLYLTWRISQLNKAFSAK